jgi:hypothetical protein
MTSTNVAESKCVEAARAIIEYEAPPGVFDLTHRYLMGLVEDAEQDVGLKLEALKLIRRVEARRVVPGAVADAEKTAQLAKRVEAARKRVARFRDGQSTAEAERIARTEAG